MEELQIWLEVARSLFLKAGFVVLLFSLVYLARHTWRARNEWRLGPPWSAKTRYLKKLRLAFAYTHQLDCLKSCALYIVSSLPASGARFNPEEAYDLESLISLAVHERKLIVLAGAAASGKTALLHTLALRAFSREHHRKLGFARPRVPFYIPLKALDCNLPFLAALNAALLATGFALPGARLKRALRRGRAVLLLDGLEVIAENSRRLELIKWLEEARLREARDAPMIIALRSEIWPAHLGLRTAHLSVVLRNFARPKLLSLGAVTETRMPKLLRNAVEANAEYLLISPQAGVLLRGANRMAPSYHFHMAKFPVTNLQYRRFVQTQNARTPLLGLEKEFAGDDLPVVGVDWEEAERYCEWLNRMAAGNNEGFRFRLPTEEEWEWAASGAARLYPWGNEEPTAAHARFGEQNAQPTSVFAHPLGATPEGVCDLAGNVWEWTATASATHPEKRIVRGGGAFNEADALRCAARDEHAKTRSRVVGFRVVRVPLKV